MKFKIAQVIGLNTDQKAALVTSSARDEDNTFLALLELEGDDAFTRGRQALSDLSDFYFDFEGTPAEKLTATFKKADETFTDLTFNLNLAAISGKVLYLIGQSGDVFLKRGDKISPLLSVGAEEQLISGFLSEGDRVFLATKNLTAFLGENLDKALSLSPEIFEQELSDQISSASLDEHGLAGLLLEVETEAGEEVIHNIPQEAETDDHYSEAMAGPTLKPLSILLSSLSRAGRLVWRLRSYFPKTNLGRIILAVALIVVIVLGVGYKYKTSKDQQKQQQFNQTLEEARADFDAAKNLSSLNPQEAKNKLDSAKDKTDKALKLKPKDQTAQNLKQQIEQDSATILQQISVSNFPLFLDLDLVKKNFRAEKLSLSSGKLLILDPTVKTLVMVDLAKKSNQILAGEEQLGEAGHFSLNGALAFVYSKDKGILRVDTNNSKLTAVAKKDPDLGSILDIYGFAGNVYLLDSGKNMIWKYLPAQEGYSDKREYLTAETKVDLTNSLRMQIESSIYILKQGGEILRFTRGAKDHFSIGGLDKGIKDPKSFFVSSDTDNLYVLDSGNSRLVILTKTGSYKGQISGDKFAQASDLVVDEKGRKVYLLDGSKIYSVDLK